MPCSILSAEPVLLEPMLAIEVRVPTDLIGNVSSVLQGKRGKVLDMQQKVQQVLLSVKFLQLKHLIFLKKCVVKLLVKQCGIHISKHGHQFKINCCNSTEDIRKKGLSPNPPAATEFIDRD